MEPEPVSPTDQRRAVLAEKENEAVQLMKTDILEWIKIVVGLTDTSEDLSETLDTGVVPCQLAKKIQAHAKNSENGKKIPMEEVKINLKASRGSFQARDNAANFIAWCRKLSVPPAIMFESEDLVKHKNDKRVVLSLLEVGRHASKVGMSAPRLVKMEEEIDATEATEVQSENEGGSAAETSMVSEGSAAETSMVSEGGAVETSMAPTGSAAETSMASNRTVIVTPVKTQPSPRPETKTKTMQKGTPVKATTDLEKNVLSVLQQCSCKDKILVHSMKNAKFVLSISNKRYTLFARVLSDRIMVRVGGGWDTLDHFLLKHDPCRAAMIPKEMFSWNNSKGTSKLPNSTASNLPGFVEADGEVSSTEADPNVPLSHNNVQPVPPPPQTANSSIVPMVAVIFMLQVVLFCLYFYGLKAAVLIGVLVMLLAYLYTHRSPPAQSLSKKEN